MKNLLLLVLGVIFSAHLLATEKFTVQQVDFLVGDSFKMKGVLYFPKNEPLKKMIVEITNRLTFKSACDSSSYDYMLMQKLVDDGVGWFLISPMSVILPMEKHICKNFQNDAVYLDSAVSYLKRTVDARSCHIGVLGQSEAGMAAAVSASRNPDIDFLISVTSFMIKGTDFFTFNLLSSENIKTHGISGTRFDMFKAFIKDTFNYNNVKYYKSDKIFMKCIESTIDTLARIIIQMNYVTINDYLNILSKTKEQFISLWDLNNSVLNNKPLMDCINLLCILMFNPHDVAFIQWNPQLYFPKINVPTLILLGDKDGLMPLEKNLNGINKIANLYNKKNITIKVLQGHGHGLSVYPSNEQNTDFEKPDKTNPNCSSTPESTINLVADWILKIKK